MLFCYYAHRSAACLSKYFMKYFLFEIFYEIYYEILNRYEIFYLKCAGATDSNK